MVGYFQWFMANTDYEQIWCTNDCGPTDTTYVVWKPYLEFYLNIILGNAQGNPFYLDGTTWSGLYEGSQNVKECCFYPTQGNPYGCLTNPADWVLCGATAGTSTHYMPPGISSVGEVWTDDSNETALIGDVGPEVYCQVPNGFNPCAPSNAVPH
jgi:hypothetical protein